MRKTFVTKREPLAIFSPLTGHFSPITRLWSPITTHQSRPAERGGDTEKRPQERLEFSERPHGGSIRWGAIRIRVDLHEDGITTRRHRRARQMRDILPQTPRGHAGPPGKLKAVGGIKDHWVADSPHHRQGPHVHDEVVVSKARPTFGDQQSVIAGGDHLFHPPRKHTR